MGFKSASKHIQEAALRGSGSGIFVDKRKKEATTKKEETKTVKLRKPSGEEVVKTYSEEQYKDKFGKQNFRPKGRCWEKARKLKKNKKAKPVQQARIIHKPAPPAEASQPSENSQNRQSLGELYFAVRDKQRNQ